ncbi:MAG: mechanosensitive ion channel [Desulfobulbaceae bacterium]|nr:mechanosensitive ion channel [Desulfobulbaceae bacterium]
MQLKIRNNIFVSSILTVCCISTTAVTLYAADAKGAAAKGVEQASQAADSVKLQEALNPDTYTHYAQLGKDWLFTNGPGLLVALIILVVGRWLVMWLASLGRKAMAKGGVDETLSRFLGKLIYYVLLTAVVIAAADQAGIKTTSFIAILGAAGLAIALALKDSLANFASGVMLILFRPFQVGDAVTAGGVTGKVQQVDIFSTIILSPDNKKFIIPNSTITAGVITQHQCRSDP